MKEKKDAIGFLKESENRDPIFSPNISFYPIVFWLLKKKASLVLIVYGGFLPPTPLYNVVIIKMIRTYMHAQVYVMTSSRNACKAQYKAFIDFKTCKLLKSRVFYQLIIRKSKTILEIFFTFHFCYIKRD